MSYATRNISKGILIALAIAAMALCAPTVSRATATLTLTQPTSGEVVASWTGSINTTGLVDTGTTKTGPIDSDNTIQGGSIDLITGYGSQTLTAFEVPATDNLNFGSADILYEQSNVTGYTTQAGPVVEADLYNDGSPFSYLWLPTTSGNTTVTLANSTAIFSPMFNPTVTIKSYLGVGPGTYTWRWGTGTDQAFILQVGCPTGSVPEPPTAAMLGAGLIAVLGLAYTRKFRMREA